jgi:hypothetical protein
MIECLAVAAGRIGSGFFMPMRNRILPGRYITDCQMRLHMSLRQAETPVPKAIDENPIAAPRQLHSSLLTRRWSEVDSNPRSHLRHHRLEFALVI